MSSRRNSSASITQWWRHKAHFHFWWLFISSKLTCKFTLNKKTCREIYWCQLKYWQANYNCIRIFHSRINLGIWGLWKTFPTPISGLPKLLFDEGFWAYTSFCKQVSSYATTDDAPCYSNIIPFGDNEVQPGIDGEDNEEINMLFMINETVIFKDGKGITQEVRYLGPVLTDGILKHKIRTWNDIKFLVDGILLFSLDSPDIEH